MFKAILGYMCRRPTRLEETKEETKEEETKQDTKEEIPDYKTLYQTGENLIEKLDLKLASERETNRKLREDMKYLEDNRVSHENEIEERNDTIRNLILQRETNKKIIEEMKIQEQNCAKLHDQIKILQEKNSRLQKNCKEANNLCQRLAESKRRILHTKSKCELQEFAKLYHVSNYSKLSKDELVERLAYF